jgi:hypothetical protein
MDHASNATKGWLDALSAPTYLTASNATHLPDSSKHHQTDSVIVSMVDT